MMVAALEVVCSGCGTRVDPARTLPFRCPAAAPDDDIDHVLRITAGDLADVFPVSGAALNPFLRYRSLTLPWQLARAAGLSDSAYGDLVATLDGAITAVDGRAPQVTPFRPVPGLATATGLPTADSLWIKDETEAVAGSHKVRHLYGVLLYLLVLERTGLPAGEGLRARRLGIASCGNAALAAAVLARAVDWPLDVFIPETTDRTTVGRLRDLGATLKICRRAEVEQADGDPCAHGFRRAVAAGTLPFSVQGPDNGLAVAGGETLAWEMIEALRADPAPSVDALFIQVGGGALASAVARGFRRATTAGLMPRLFAVQTAGCAPLARAWQHLQAQRTESGQSWDTVLATAARQRATFMWPWETTPMSLATGILDDETYDWLGVLEAVAHSGGDVVVVGETDIASAHALAGRAAGRPVSPTGSAGLAGLLATARCGHLSPPLTHCAVLLTGREA